MKTSEQKISALNPETAKVGDGVTWSVGSDRYAATIVEVSASGKTITFVDDDYKATGDYYGNQTYEYTPVEPFETTDPMGGTRTNKKTARWNAKAGCFKFYGRCVAPGRSMYRDPSF